MKSDIKACSMQYLQSVFNSLEQYHDHVFWIRNHDMSQQIYVSHTYEVIWNQDRTILYDIPLIWFEYLEKNDKNYYMQQLQQRHVEHYCDEQKNLVFYQIQNDFGPEYIGDKCYRFKSQDSAIYIAGISNKLPANLWDTHFSSQSLSLTDDQPIHDHFFHLLDKYFGLTLIKTSVNMGDSIDNVRFLITQHEKINLTTREIECLRCLCHGKTAKETAKELVISPRTVESFLDNIRSKTGCQNKLQVIGRFAPYFISLFHLDNPNKVLSMTP